MKPLVSATVERHISAAPEVLYDLVADVRRMGEWCQDCVEAKWIGAPGATITGVHPLPSTRRWRHGSICPRSRRNGRNP
jgi:hypothetical protein